MDIKVNYAGITRRVAAYLIDHMILISIFLFISSQLSDKLFVELFYDIFSDADITFSLAYILGVLISKALYVALEASMIIKLGWTPGRLLFGIHVKDANTLKNITLAQAMTRSTFKVLLFVPIYISEWFSILPIFALIPAIFDQRKQIFYDKIASTVAINYKPSS